MMRALLSIVVACLLLGLAGPVAAQSRSIEEGPIVRRQLLYRSSRLEVEPSLGHTLSASYRRTLSLNVNAEYHLTNVFSLGLLVGWGALNYNSGLANDIEDLDPQRARDIYFTDTTLLTNFHLGWVPFYGKFNFLNAGTVHWDFHLVGGIGGALQSSEDPNIEGFKFGPVLGGGFRFFFDGDMALAINIVDYMFSTAAISSLDDPAEQTFSHTVMLTIGVSFFVTGEARVSR